MLNSSKLMELNKRQAQYLALQNQINPHFLYNTLESIRSEALVAGLTALAEMTEALASFFRYTISKVENLVSVEEELQNCETYFKIQRYRFAERLQLTIEYDSEEREEIFLCRLPKLTMQPILENSIIHGTECKIGTGHLKIHLERTGKLLLIRISDDGVGMDEQTLARMNSQLQQSARAIPSQNAQAEGASPCATSTTGSICCLGRSTACGCSPCRGWAPTWRSFCRPSPATGTSPTRRRYAPCRRDICETRYCAWIR